MDIAGMGPIGTAMLVSFLATVAFQLLCFSVAATLRIDKITDLAGCTNFIALAIMTLLMGSPAPTVRQTVLTLFVCVSRAELGLFLLYRVLKRGRDSRFDTIRDSCCVFLVFWIWQMMWCFVVSLSVIYVNSAPVPDAPLGAADFVGWGLIVVGFALQVWADLIKLRFRSNPDNTEQVCTLGPWYYSRHPNFCGEVLLWWGCFVCGIPVFHQSTAGWATVVSPIFTMLVLLCVTGIPQAEGQSSKRWFDGGAAQVRYETYFESTPPLWLCPPLLYRRLPKIVKLVICFELPIYRYHGVEPTGLAAREGSN
jgi:steroid 5-alpha reductase family enzyme